MADITLPILMKVTLQSFCKSNKILGVPIKDLYDRYKATYCLLLHKGTVTQYDFEKGLEALNKGVIKHLKKKCIAFIQDECPNTYEAFIERNEFITKEFWYDIRSQVRKDTHKSQIPPNWDVMPFSDKLKFAESIKDRGFKAYIMAKDPKIKEYFNSQIEKPPEMAFQELFPQKINTPVLPPEMIAPVPPKSHKEKMPVDWLNMSFSDRLDFAKAIGDKDFKAYVLAQDPKIKEYLERLENRKPHAEPFNLYVTLFSFPTKSATPKARALVKELIGALNKLGRGRLQYVELLDPHVIEIREVK